MCHARPAGRRAQVSKSVVAYAHRTRYVFVLERLTYLVGGQTGRRGTDAQADPCLDLAIEEEVVAPDHNLGEVRRVGL